MVAGTGKGKTVFIILLGASLLWIGGSPQAAPDDLALHTVLERLSEDSLSFVHEPASARYYEEFVDHATRGKPFPVDCFTPVAGALGTRPPSLKEAGVRVLQGLRVKPSFDFPETYPVGGWLRIHFTTDPASPHAVAGWDRNRNQIPDLPESVASAAESFFDLAIRTFRFQPPGTRRDGSASPYDLFLVRLPDPIRGITVPPTPRRDPSGEPDSGFLLLDPGDPPSPEGLLAVVAHHLAHAVQFSYTTRLPAWWQEASSVWLEKEVTNDVLSHRDALAERLQGPHHSLASDSLKLMQGAYLWPLYLVEANGHDPALIRLIWEETALREDPSLREVTDGVLRRLHGISFEKSFLHFAIWNLHTGRRDDGNHYRFGAHLPDPAPPSLYDSFPAVARWEDTIVEPLGTRLLALETESPSGGLEFHLYGEEGTFWQAAALVEDPDHPGRSYFQEIPLDEANHGLLRLPWDDAARVIILIQNLGGEEAGDRRIGFTSLLDPHYPFVLASLGARGENGQVVLEWSSSQEQDLLGWNIYRSPDPLRGFSRINRLLLPGGGDSREITNYLFIDQASHTGRHYYYYVEGVTLDGFAQRSHIVGARSLPRPRIPAPR